MLRRFLAATSALALAAYPAAAQTPPRAAVLGIGPGATSTFAPVTINDGTRDVPIGVLNPSKHSFAFLAANVAAHVDTDADLRAYGLFPLPGAIQRDGFYKRGDGGEATFYYSPVPCGAALQVPAADGKFWCSALDKSADMRVAGARCDGASDDSPALAALLAAMRYGGEVVIPATGHACVLNTGVTLPSNLDLRGYGGHHWSGLDFADPQAWASAGSSLQCNDTVSTCLHINGVGNHLSGINLVYAQPAPPSSGSWTPKKFPYAITIDGSANYWGLDDITITAATHCIDVEGPPSGVAGIASHMRNIYFNGCFDNPLRIGRIDNTLTLDNLRFQYWWYADDAAVVNYVVTHRVGMDLHYLANAQFSNIELFHDWRAIQLTNDCVTSGFGQICFAVNDLQFTNVSFNEDCQAVVPATSDARGAGVMTNVIAYRDTDAGACPTAGAAFFDFSTPYALWSLSHVQGGYLQTVADVGPGSSVKITDLDVQKYSAFAAGGQAFGIAAGAQLSLGVTQMNGIRPAANAGPVIGCSVATPSSCGPLYPIESGPLGQGSVKLENGDTSYTGIASFYDAAGARQGFVGRVDPTNHSMLVQSDNGPLSLVGGKGPVSMQARGAQIGTFDLVNGGQQLKIGNAGQGTARVEAGDGSYTGITSFYDPNGNRQGFVGRVDPTNHTLLLQSDNGPLALVGNGGAVSVQAGGSQVANFAVVGGKTVITFAGLPGSCSGLPSGALYNNAGAIGICP